MHIPKRFSEIPTEKKDGVFWWVIVPQYWWRQWWWWQGKGDDFPTALANAKRGLGEGLSRCPVQVFSTTDPGAYVTDLGMLRIHDPHPEPVLHFEAE